MSSNHSASWWYQQHWLVNIKVSKDLAVRAAMTCDYQAGQNSFLVYLDLAQAISGTREETQHSNRSICIQPDMILQNQRNSGALITCASTTEVCTYAGKIASCPLSI